MDYTVMLAGLLDPPGVDWILDQTIGKPKDIVDSGGLPIGRGAKENASSVLQGLYVAVNLVFTFASEAIESGLRKIGSAAKSLFAAVWSKIGGAIMDVVKAPAFMFMGAGGIGGVPPGRIGPRPPGDLAPLRR